MALDLDGKKLYEIMQHKDMVWLEPPLPYWRLEPPSILRWFTQRMWSLDNYDLRFQKILQALIDEFPGSYVSYSLPPEGLSGEWDAAALKNPPWKDGQTGTYLRKSGDIGVWKIPEGAVVAEMAGWLKEGGWSIWMPTKEKMGPPRNLAQGAYQTVVESDYRFLMSSWWDNAFSEVALHPELAFSSTESSDKV
jgi:hypothetical protein